MLWFKKEFVYSWYKWPGSGSSPITRTQACCFTTRFLTCNILTCDLENYPHDYLIRLLKWLNDIENYCDSKMTAACKQHLRYLWETAPKQQGEMSVYTWFWWKGNTCKWMHIFFPPVSASLMKLSANHENSHHPGGFQWFSRYEEIQELGSWDFPGGTLDKNPPANEGNLGSIPCRGGSHAKERLSHPHYWSHKKRIGFIKAAPENIYLKNCPASFLSPPAPA